MKCIICGNEIPSGEAFCPVCGAAAPGENISYGAAASVDGKAYGAEASGEGKSYGAEVSGNGKSYVAVSGGSTSYGDAFRGAGSERESSRPQAAEKTDVQGHFVPQGSFPPVFQQTPGFQEASDYDPYAGIHQIRQEKAEQENRKAARKKKRGPIIACVIGGMALIALFVMFLMGVFHLKNGTYIWDDYAFDGTSLELELKGNKGVLTATYRGKTDTQEVEVTFDGSKTYISANGKYIEGTYNRRDQTISFADDSLQGFDIVMKKE